MCVCVYIYIYIYYMVVSVTLGFMLYTFVRQSQSSFVCTQLYSFKNSLQKLFYSHIVEWVQVL